MGLHCNNMGDYVIIAAKTVLINRVIGKSNIVIRIRIIQKRWLWGLLFLIYVFSTFRRAFI